VLERYFASRRFQSPYRTSTETVSPLSALWAFLLGPIYYWRKRAPIEALLFVIAMGVPLLIDDDAGMLGSADALDLGSAIWLAFAVAAPVALPSCYRRKEWAEITPRRRQPVEEPAVTADR
jgi:hypothetical protein